MSQGWAWGPPDPPRPGVELQPLPPCRQPAPRRVGSRRDVPGRTGLYWTAVGCAGQDRAGLDCTGLGWTAPSRVGPYWAVPDCTELVCAGPYWAVLDQPGLYHTERFWTLLSRAG